jgi:hypothetical protein
MKREHKLEALCVDGSVISFEQIEALRGRVVRHGSWHYLQIPGEPERAIVIRQTLREHLREMGDYAVAQRKGKSNYALRFKEAAKPWTSTKPPKVVRPVQVWIDEASSFDWPHLDNMRRTDGDAEAYVMV